jgi:hypothetical protein
MTKPFEERRFFQNSRPSSVDCAIELTTRFGAPNHRVPIKQRNVEKSVAIALRQSCQYINKVFLFFDKRQVAALRTQQTSILEDPDQLPADAPFSNMTLHLYIVE